MIALCSILLVISLIPTDHYICAQDSLKKLWRSNDPLQRGCDLYNWMDSFGPGSVSINLSTNIPSKDSYLPFSEIIHELWHLVQLRGGSLSELLRPVKLLLREDLKRSRRQRQVLRGAYAQLIFMTGLVWIYLYLFSYMMSVKYDEGFLVTLIGWQLFGVFLFWYALKSLRIRHFGPFKSSLDLLLQLTAVAQQGNLGSAHLTTDQRLRSSSHEYFKERIFTQLRQWQKQGFAKTEALNPLREDLMLLASDSTQSFLDRLKVFTFLWALLFVLPPLFAGSLFGLYKLVVV